MVLSLGQFRQHPFQQAGVDGHQTILAKYLQNGLDDEKPYGMNLLSGPLEGKTVDLFLEYRIRNVEAGTYMQLTPALVKYRLKGLSRNGQNGTVLPKNRIMGRRLCINDNNHPNNIFIDAIKPDGDKCRVCGGDLKTRSDDQDEGAIDKRHNIYYDTVTGTTAAIIFFKAISEKNNGTPKIIGLDGRPGVKEVSDELLGKLK